LGNEDERWVNLSERDVALKKIFVGFSTGFEADVKGDRRFTETLARFIEKAARFVGKVERLLTNDAIFARTGTRFVENGAIDIMTQMS